MINLTSDIEQELLTAMDNYKAIAEVLIEKLITETDQPEKEKINLGHYYEIQDADFLNGQKALSGDWSFFVHGEHCMFENLRSGQILEVSLGNKESIGNLDPYFFYNFLKTTVELNHLTKYFVNPFSSTLDFFEKLERENILTTVFGVYRKR
jgi:hypothetical protein